MKIPYRFSTVFLKNILKLHYNQINIKVYSEKVTDISRNVKFLIVFNFES